MKCFIIISLAVSLSIHVCAQEAFTVKDVPIANRHKRSIVLGNSIAINALSVAKSSGISVEEFATQMGDNWATTWNKEAGFKGLVGGFLWNNSSFINEDQSNVEILEQNDQMVKIKVVKHWGDLFSNGDVFGVSEKEFIKFWHISGERIADYMGCTLETNDDGEHLIQVISKK